MGLTVEGTTKIAGVDTPTFVAFALAVVTAPNESEVDLSVRVKLPEFTAAENLVVSILYSKFADEILFPIFGYSCRGTRTILLTETKLDAIVSILREVDALQPPYTTEDGGTLITKEVLLMIAN